MTPNLLKRAEALNAKLSRSLSRVKKRLAPHMWVLSRDSAGGYLITIGDPRKPSSKIIARHSDPDEIRYWVRYEMPGKVSEDHVMDLTGMKLVPPFHTEWFVENIQGA